MLLYECLSGQRAFQGKAVNELFLDIRAGKLAPLRKVCPGVPWAMVSIVKRAMRVKAADRYFDAAQMRRDLELFLARRVEISHSALLIAFLFQRGRLSQGEVLERITRRELHALDAIEAQPVRFRRRQWVLGALAAAASLALAMTQQTWWIWFKSLWR